MWSEISFSYLLQSYMDTFLKNRAITFCKFYKYVKVFCKYFLWGTLGWGLSQSKIKYPGENLA